MTKSLSWTLMFDPLSVQIGFEVLSPYRRGSSACKAATKTCSLPWLVLYPASKAVTDQK